MTEIEKVFDKEEALSLLAGLIKTPSENPTGTEEAAGRYMRDVLEKNGIESELSWAAPGRPNIVARIKGKGRGKSLLFNGHLDTVPAGDGWSVDPFGAVVKDGRMYGRGASDMKAGVACMAYAAILLHRMGNPFGGELVLFFNSDEERCNAGVKKYVENGDKTDYAVIGEPSDLDVCIGHRGAARFWLKTFGTPGHTSFVRNPDNAIYKMVKMVEELERLGHEVRNRRHPFIGQSSLTVAEIHGGTAPNIVPGLCSAHIDRRTLPGEKRDEVTQEIDKCLAEAAKKGPFSYELDCYQFMPATYLEQDHVMVRTMAASASAVREKNCAVKAFEATCEAPFFALDQGIPTIVFGPGSIKHAHTIDEYVEVDEVADGALIYADFVRRLLPLA